MKKRNYIIISMTDMLIDTTCIERDGKLYRSLSDPATVFDNYAEAYKLKRKNEMKMQRDGDIFCHYFIIPIEVKK